MASKRAAPVNDAASRRTVAHTRISDTKGVEDTYDLGDILGKGSFGVVQVAIHKKSGEKWACKSLDKQKAGSSAVRQLEREVGILKRVNHKHVVQLREVLEAPKKIYLIMELCDGGDLLTCLEERKYLPEKDVAIIMKRLADVIAYLHDNEIVHRDLKLENILLSRADPNDPLNIKVSDFGLSYIKGKEGAMMSTMCGTPIYMAPEVIGKLGYSQQCDIWSMGIIMYFLLCGSPPFYDKDEEVLYERINKGDVSFDGPVWSEISSQAKNLIQGMLKTDPAHRFTAKEIMDHVWISNRDNAEGTPLASNVLDMMRAYNAERRFKRAIYGVITARAVAEYFIGYFTSDFRKRRPRGAGKPSKEELEAEAAAAAAQAQSQAQTGLGVPEGPPGHHRRSPSTHKLGINVVSGGHSSHNVLAGKGAQAAAGQPQKKMSGAEQPGKGVMSPTGTQEMTLPSVKEPSAADADATTAHAENHEASAGATATGGAATAAAGEESEGVPVHREDSGIADSAEDAENEEEEGGDTQGDLGHAQSSSAIGKTPVKKASTGSRTPAKVNGKGPLKSASGGSMGSSGQMTPKNAKAQPRGTQLRSSANAATASTSSLHKSQPKKGSNPSITEKVTPLNLGASNGKSIPRTPNGDERPRSAGSNHGEDLKLPRITSAGRAIES